MTTEIPALRQSTEVQMACEHGYALVNIEGLKPPETEPSIRGTYIHAVLAPYRLHCARKKIPADFAYLDKLIEDAGEEAAEILIGCRDNLTVDWQNLFGVEVSWGMDEDFLPTYSYDHDGNAVAINPIFGLPGTGKPPVYCGIDDAIYIFQGGKAALIEDDKSHPRPFDATTIQSKRYALALFMHMPELESVNFRLRFVRYTNILREHTYLRADVPDLMEDVRRERARQVAIHRKYAEKQALRVTAGSHCVYCPAIIQGNCPIRKLNPMMAMSVEDRLNFRLWLDVQNRANNAAMKAHIDATGQPIYTQDSAGKVVMYGPIENKTVTFPVFSLDAESGLQTPIIDAVVEWITDPDNKDLHPKRQGTLPFWAQMRISSTKFKSAIKAKSRAALHQRIMDHGAVIESKVKLQVQRDPTVDDGTGEEYREYGDDE